MDHRPLRTLLLTLLIVTTEAYAQFGGFGFPPMPEGGMGMPDMGSMFPAVKHTKVEELKSDLPVITITTDTALNAREKVTAHMKTDGYDGPIGIKLRGNSSLAFNQKKYTWRPAATMAGRWTSVCWECLPTANGCCWRHITTCR